MTGFSWNSFNKEILERRYHGLRGKLPSHGFTLFLGPRGSGKTTFLRFLSKKILEEKEGQIPVYLSFHEILSGGNFAERLSVEILRGVSRRIDSIPNFPFPSDILLKRLKDQLPTGLGRELELIIPAIISSEEIKALSLSLNLPELLKSFGIELLIIWDDFDMLWKADLRDYAKVFIGRFTEIDTPPHIIAGSWGYPENFYMDLPSHIKSIPCIQWSPLNRDETGSMVLFLSEKTGVKVEEGFIPYIHLLTEGNPLCIHSIIKSSSEMGVRIESINSVSRVYSHAVTSGDIYLYWKRILREAFSDPSLLREVLSFTEYLSDGRSISLSAIPDRFPLLDLDKLKAIMRMGLIRISGENLSILDGRLTGDVLRGIRGEIIERQPADLLMMDIFRDLTKRDILSEAEDRNIILSMKDVINKMSGLKIPRRFFTYEDQPVDDTISFPHVIFSCLIEFDPCEMKAHIISLCCDGDKYSAENERLISMLIVTGCEVDVKHVESLLRFTLRYAMQRKFDLWKIRNWIVSKMGFSEAAIRRIGEEHLYATDWERLKELLKFLEMEYIFLKKREEKEQETEYEIVIPVASEAETIAAKVAEEIASRLEFDEDEVQKIKIALIEACINAFEHAFDEKKKVFVKFSISDDRLLIVVRNYGRKIDLERVEREVMEKKLAGIKKRGWGIIIMKEMMDEVVFEDVEMGTKLKLIKYRRKKGEEA